MLILEQLGRSCSHRLWTHFTALSRCPAVTVRQGFDGCRLWRQGYYSGTLPSCISLRSNRQEAVAPLPWTTFRGVAATDRST